MKRLPFLCAVTLMATALLGCHFSGMGNAVSGSGVRKTEKRDVAPFHAIETEGAFELEATCQKPESLEIEADDNILPLIQSEVSGGVLHLKAQKAYNSRQGVIVRISVPNLDSLSGTGAGKFRIQGVKNDNFEVHTTGAANVVASGETKNIEVHTTGAGSVDTHGLHAEKANVSSTGAAKVDVYASEQLDASVSGVGRITYSGEPKTVNKHVTGAGTIDKRESTGY
ncbi:MAG: hypothetical protein JWM21_379 [Acidobacteria bacterium]|nr:hypothetical protein [Acidobacteriota bacterium]